MNIDNKPVGVLHDSEVIYKHPGEPDEVVSYTYVEQHPEFRVSMIKYTDTAIHLSKRKRLKYQGDACVLQFVVDENGKVQDVKILQSIGTKKIDAKILRAFSSMPAWNNGYQNGIPVRCRLLYNFILRS